MLLATRSSSVFIQRSKGLFNLRKHCALMQAGAAIVSLKRLTMFLTLEDRQDEVIDSLSLPVDIKNMTFNKNSTQGHG